MAIADLELGQKSTIMSNYLEHSLRFSHVASTRYTCTWLYIVSYLVSVDIPELTCGIDLSKSLQNVSYLVLDGSVFVNLQRLAESNLLQFSSLIELYEALGRYVAIFKFNCCTYWKTLDGMFFFCSHRGTFYVLCTPDICHSEESQKYGEHVLFPAFHPARDGLHLWEPRNEATVHVKYCTGSHKSFHEAGFDAFCVGFGKLM